MKSVNVYQIWSLGSLSEGEEPCPLFLEYEDLSYLKVYEEFRRMHEESMCAIFVASKIVDEASDADKKIYESPDNGKTVYVRKFGSSLRILLNDDEADRLRGLFRIK